MGGTDLEPWETVQCALENQMREGNRGFDRIADNVGQQAIALQALLEVRDALGMDKNERPEGLCLGPKGMKLGIRQLLTVDASPDGSAAQSQLLDSFF